MKIAFFDSGIGGITVLSEAVRLLPQSQFIYFADTANVPYGTKPKETVKKLVFESVEFIIQMQIDALVVACNTATSIAINDLRAKYKIPILGMEPAVKPAIQNNKSVKNKRILVVATPLTLKEEKYKNLVSTMDTENLIDSIPLPELVEYAENFEFSEDVILSYFNNKFGELDLSQYGTIVLGCTHFPFYMRQFQKYFGSGIDIIHGNNGTVRHLKNSLPLNPDHLVINPGKIEFYSSLKNNNEPERLEKYFNFYQNNQVSELILT